MGTIFWVLVGLFAGWNIPQPGYAKAAQAMAVAKWKEFRGSTKPDA